MNDFRRVFCFISILTFACCVFNESSFGQNEKQQAGQLFISLHGGGYTLSKEIKQEAYGRSPKLEYGGTIGYPIGRSTYLYVKGSYFSASGAHISEWTTYDPQTGEVIDKGREKDGTSDFQQFRINGGLQQAIPLPSEFFLFLNTGITIIRTKDEIDRYEMDPYTDEREGWLGFFGGLGVEKRFQNSPFSLFSEVQYNTTNDNFLIWVGDFGGFSYSFGIRLYIPR